MQTIYVDGITFFQACVKSRDSGREADTDFSRSVIAALQEARLRLKGEMTEEENKVFERTFKGRGEFAKIMATTYPIFIIDHTASEARNHQFAQSNSGFVTLPREAEVVAAPMLGGRSFRLSQNQLQKLLQQSYKNERKIARMAG